MAAKKTISDVARIAGVGVGTVSRVINDAPGVSPAMAQRVHEVMERIGYAPPMPQFRPGPRRRKAVVEVGERPVIELVIMFRLGLGWMAEQAPVYSSALDGIEAAVTAAGMDLVVRQTDSWQAPTRADGPAPVGRIYFGALESRELPPRGQFDLPSVWVMGNPPDAFAGDHVQSDPMVAGQLAAQHLLDNGHSCCAYLGSGLGTPLSYSGYRGDAFRFHIERGGGTVHLAIDPELIRTSKQANLVDAERVREQLQRMLRMNPKPTGIFLQADMFAPCVYKLLEELRVRPQRDLAVVTCNNEPTYLRRLWPAPTVVDIQVEQISARAVEMLLWRRDNPGRPPIRVLVRPVLRT
jgi:LacI family transcriptional regulator